MPGDRISVGTDRWSVPTDTGYGFTSTHTRWWSLPSAIFASGLSLAGQNTPLPMYSKPVEGST